MKKLFNKIDRQILSVLTLYFAPIFLLCIFAAWKADARHFLDIFALGLILSCGGSVAAFFLLKQSKIFPSPPPPVVAPPPPETDSAEIEELQAAVQELEAAHAHRGSELESFKESAEKAQRDLEDFRQEYGRLERDLALTKESADEQLEQKRIFLEEYQKTISEQRLVIEKKQFRISELEGKVNDLNYEIKTLLQFNEQQPDPLPTPQYMPKGHMIEETPAPYYAAPPEMSHAPVITDKKIKTGEEAMRCLRRCIDMAQKITGASHLNNRGSRFRDLAANNHALDIRRLCDSLQSEHGATVLLFSLKENRLLFANDQARQLLGWTPEKFVQNFDGIIQQGGSEWRNATSHLSDTPNAQVRLLLKSKSGENLLTHCFLGSIPTGLFKNHAIGILYPA